MIWLTVLAAAAGLFELARRGALPPQRLIGDEAEYAARATSDHPYSPEPFLRPPGMIWIVTRCPSVAACRWWMSACSAATVVCVGGAAHALTGSVATGAIAAGLLLALPDRVVLSAHLWPDIPSAMLHAALAWLLLSGVTASRSSASAIVGMAAIGLLLPLLRIDAAAIAATAALLLADEWWWLTPVASLLTIAALTAMHSARHGIRSPDTTSWFNVTLLAATTAQDEREPLEPVMIRCYARWLAQSNAERADAARSALRWLAASPRRTTAQLARRVVQLLGADTFGIQLVLHPDDGAYPSLSPRSRRRIEAGLSVSYSLLVALAVAGAVHGGVAARSAVVGAAGLFTAAAVNARTRFRHCTLPWLVVPAATYLWRPDVPATATLLTALAALAVARRVTGPRSERHGAGGVAEATRCDGTVPIHFPHV